MIYPGRQISSIAAFDQQEIVNGLSLRTAFIRILAIQHSRA